ncbi:uncharacterized protein [Rutidosis leptorrhynchoides]|uniref:uncharacterized protein n=1 Tax=Rutidosis leptorrhynchoides TaxID=125765 RepID=UPI003A99C2DA
MKLKPSKCSFGEEEEEEEEGSFMGHVITTRGIKANPKKIEAIEFKPSPKTKKQKKSAIKWTEEAEKAFQEMKELLKNLPTLTTPIDGETLILYLVIAREAVSYVPITESDGVQTHIYFLSKTLAQSELEYLPIKKFVYALVKYYVTPATILPSSPDSSTDISAYSADSVQTKNIRTINELGHRVGRARNHFSRQKHSEGINTRRLPGRIHFRYANHTRLRRSYVTNALGIIYCWRKRSERSRFNFKATNNEAEYEALLVGVRLAKDIGVKKLEAYVESQLVTNQINGTFDAHDEGMQS